MKENLTNYFNFMKEHKAVIKNTKLVLLIIVNIWLFAIFWKILILSDINIINNNHLLTKATLLFQPILSVLGIDLLTPNMLKMIVLSFIVIFTNLSVLYFNQMASIIILSVFARYSYKSYTNYLINKENLNYLGFENKKEIVEEIPQVIIQQVPQVIESSTNWWQWGAIGCVCLIAVGGIIFMVWSHNQSMNGIIDTNENVASLSENIKNSTTHINERITRSASQIDYNNNYTTNLFKGLDKKVDLIDEKVKDLNWTVQSVGENLTKVAELNNKNTLALSQQSLNLSRQASEALTEIADSTTVVEATTVGLAHIWEIVKGFSTRIEVLEAKSNITTPRASMHFKAPPMPPHKDDM
jgi:hypothetical protein